MLLPNDFLKMDLSKRRKVYGLKLLQSADSLLTGEVKCIYKSYVISQYIIDMGMYQLAEEIIKDRKNGITSKYINYLEKYLQNKMTLKKGEKAPEFYLLSSKNEYKNLADYKGKIVLLNFWFPGCTGCKLEIPYEKKLVTDYKGKAFQLINICFYTSSKEVWYKAINEFGMEGINLYANGNWQNKLIEKYKITAYPHYTLIDDDLK